ncbi:beta strand repeat-containing protein [Chryseobacterium sp. PMSZPI]|uniref:beta strand repeat-containing protein n=1 Tax=Chryseobacterium sp. PMSZPI TaxID=1033900 RepID=UPI0039A216E5
MAKYKYLLAFLWLLILSTKIWAADYYWVGGSGNWSDINHWRTTSGGSTIPTVVPGPTDNVYFDVNSGFTTASRAVRLDVTGNAHNITFSGSAVAPTFTQSGTQTLNIYGSSEWQSGMGTVNIANIYYRNNNENKTITSNGVITGQPTTSSSNGVYFEETMSISLQDDFNVNSNLNLQRGTWNTNDHTVTIYSDFFANSGAASRIMNLGSSDIFLRSGSCTFNTANPNLTLNAGTSNIHFTNFSSTFSNLYGFIAQAGQSFYDLTLDNVNSLPTTRIISGGTAANPLNFHKVELKGSATILGYNNFNQLILGPTKSYILPSVGIQTISDLFSANTPSCTGWTTINTPTVGAAATISASASTTITVSGVVMRDITGTGGANFTAQNSVDNGNNTGWAFPPSTGQNLYWVGGSGNWNDNTHWSNASGGTGGYCVPGPGDNVFFDAGSGFTTTSRTVTLDGTGYVHNIIFSGSAVAPTFTQSGTQTLNIYGSSEWQSGMGTINIANIYYRNNNEDKTITSNGVITGLQTTSSSNGVYFEETMSISLQDDFNVNSNLNLQRGTWNTNDHTVTIYSDFYANSSLATKTMNLGSSNIFLRAASSTFNTANPNLTLNAGTSNIHFTNLSSLSVNLYGFIAQAGQSFYDLTLDNVNSLPTTRIISGGTAANPLNFHKVELKGSATILGYNNFNQLILGPTKSYILPSVGIQTISDLFSANTPSCTGWTTINTPTVGAAATISASASTTITVSGVVMRDITGTGGANFTAQNSVDNGNNTGWAFPPSTGQNLYWVGGSGNWNDNTHWANVSGGTGGYCVPGPGDNVFFDSGSGFTTTSRTVTLDGTGYAHNITFSGSAVAPTFTQSGTQTLNIYGSSEWQSGMGSVNIANIYYRNNNEDKTITSNGVITGFQSSSPSNGVYFEETMSISLQDDFNVNSNLNLQRGTWNTNDHTVTIYSDFYANSSLATRTMNLGSSNIFLRATSSTFNTANPNLTVNAGTSNIHFTNLSSLSVNLYGFIAQAGQNFYDLTLDNVNSLPTTRIISGGTAANPLNFHKVELKGSATILGYNNFNELFLGAGKTFTLASGATQTITNWVLSGTPCSVTFVQSSAAGVRANVNVTGGNTNFNFVNIKDINASGASLHFGEQSTDGGNNNNITFDPYNPGGFNGLGPDWGCHTIDNTDPSTYTLGTSGFYGNAFTTYKWYKLNDPNYDPNIVISTANEIDIRTYGGYGTYKVTVTYSDGTSATCEVSNQLTIVQMTQNPTASASQTLCGSGSSATVAALTATGTDLKWYNAVIGGTALPSTTPVVNGQTYYVSQTIGGCESNRTAVTVSLKATCNPVMVNPGIRLRVKQ